MRIYPTALRRLRIRRICWKIYIYIYISWPTKARNIAVIKTEIRNPVAQRGRETAKHFPHGRVEPRIVPQKGIAPRWWSEIEILKFKVARKDLRFGETIKY